MDYFRIEHNNLAPKKGRILISEPFLKDSYFKRSVIIIVEHNDEGTIGFVLNNHIDFNISDVVRSFPPIDAEISIGGPVETETVHFIHTLGDIVPESSHVFSDIFWGGDFESIRSMTAKGLIKANQIRFFIGFSSWYPGQLAREISENSWMVAEIDSSKIMLGKGEEFWKDNLSKLGERYKTWSDYPLDPKMN